jgi:hypothetical protein
VWTVAGTKPRRQFGSVGNFSSDAQARAVGMLDNRFSPFPLLRVKARTVGLPIVAGVPAFFRVPVGGDQDDYDNGLCSRYRLVPR